MQVPKILILVVLFLVFDFGAAALAGVNRDWREAFVLDHPGQSTPLFFETNQGQVDDQVRFLARGSGYTLYLLLLGKGMPAFAISGFQISLLGADPRSRIEGAEGLATRINYLRGADSRKWQTGIKTYAKVTYHHVYPGIDLVFYGNQRQLEYDFVVSPGADPKRIKLKLDAAGAHKDPAIAIDASGDLLVDTEAGRLRFQKPRAYQDINGKRHTIAVRFVLSSLFQENGSTTRQLSFAADPYDRSYPLIIDPVVTYSTYLGGNGADWGNDIVVDRVGNVYVTGETLSSDLPTRNALFPNPEADSDAFVAKLNAGGSEFDYITYLGGSYNDQGNGIAVDKAGNVYVTGQTWSPDFLADVKSKSGLPGSADAFVVKLKPNGKSLVYAAYLGGGDYDVGHGIVVDGSGSAYVAGETASADFPARNALQPNLKGGSDAFIVKLAPDGRTLTYATFLGGGDYDVGYSVAVDGSGSAYVAGETASADFPARNALQPNLRGGSDAFIVKLAPDGRTLAYATYLGGSGFEEGSGIAVDRSGSAYVTGWTWSSDFPIANALYSNRNGLKDVFVTKLDTRGKLSFSTYLGGEKDDVGRQITVDKSGNVYVVGSTKSPDFPTHNALFPALGGDSDSFIVKLDASGGKLGYATYFGGSGFDEARGIAIDSIENIYITGQTWSPDFPKVNAVFPNLGASGDAFIVKISNP